MIITIYIYNNYDRNDHDGTSRGMRKEVQEHMTQRALIKIDQQSDIFDQSDKWLNWSFFPMIIMIFE